MRLAAAKIAPDEHHRRAGRRGQQDEPGNVAVDLASRQIRLEQPADEKPAEKRHRERLDRPVDKQRHADAAPMLAHPRQGSKIDLHQHGNNHQPDQRRNRQIDLGDLGRPDNVEKGGKGMPQRDSNDDAKSDPHGKIAFEKRHTRSVNRSCDRCRQGALST